MSQQFINALQSSLPTEVTVNSYLDRGGQGAVFKGSAFGSPAAVKVFAPQANPKRLERELDLLRGIQCPHLVRILWNGFATVGTTSYPVVAYEFHAGGDLRRFLLPSEPKMDGAALARLGLHVSEAVEALWAQRIVHRDIKPGNIVQAADGRFVLVDVGLARHLDRSDITAPGASPGTIGYKSPEQANGRRHLTIKSDWFALGVTLYEVAARRHPFNRVQSVFGMAAPTPLNMIRPDVSTALSRLVGDMMAERPVMRPRDIYSRFQQLTSE